MYPTSFQYYTYNSVLFCQNTLLNALQLKTYLESPYSLSANNQIQYFQITVLPTPLVVSASAMHLILPIFFYQMCTRMPFVMVTLFLIFHIQFFIEFLFRLIRLDFFHCLTPAVKYLFVKTSPSSSVKPPYE